MSIVKLPLSNGGVTIVDDDVAEKLKGKILQKSDRRGYVRIRSGKHGCYIHRYITNAPEGMVVDHLNGDKADNRLANLRVCTQSENLLNQRVDSRALSKYRHVYKNSKRADWSIRMGVRRKTLYFGDYRSKHIASIFADQILVKMVGPFVLKNFQEKISSSCLADFLDKTSGRIFRVVFSRRSDGRQREMTCRTGVHTRQAGGTILFDPISMGLFSVYDVQKKAYRFIPLENVICIRYAKTNYRIVA